MSLVQRVTSIEGTDRQPPQLPESWTSPGLSPYRPQHHGYGTINGNYQQPGHLQHTEQQYSSLRGKGSTRSLRHVLSYDAIARTEEPSQATHPTGGKYAYKVSTAKRLGQYLS
jgi:hypothetical protein